MDVNSYSLWQKHNLVQATKPQALIEIKVVFAQNLQLYFANSPPPFASISLKLTT